jgi:hypothetical protein
MIKTNTSLHLLFTYGLWSIYYAENVKGKNCASIRTYNTSTGFKRASKNNDYSRSSGKNWSPALL